MWCRPFNIKLRKIFQRRIDQCFDVSHAILMTIALYIGSITLFIFLRIKVLSTLWSLLRG